MLWFDLLVPLIAAAAVGCGILYIRREAAKLDRTEVERRPGE